MTLSLSAMLASHALVLNTEVLQTRDVCGTATIDTRQWVRSVVSDETRNKISRRDRSLLKRSRLRRAPRR